MHEFNECPSFLTLIPSKYIAIYQKQREEIKITSFLLYINKILLHEFYVEYETESSWV